MRCLPPGVFPTPQGKTAKARGEWEDAPTHHGGKLRRGWQTCLAPPQNNTNLSWDPEKPKLQIPLWYWGSSKPLLRGDSYHYSPFRHCPTLIRGRETCMCQATRKRSSLATSELFFFKIQVSVLLGCQVFGSWMQELRSFQHLADPPV